MRERYDAQPGIGWADEWVLQEVDGVLSQEKVGVALDCGSEDTSVGFVSCHLYAALDGLSLRIQSRRDVGLVEKDGQLLDQYRSSLAEDAVTVPSTSRLKRISTTPASPSLRSRRPGEFSLDDMMAAIRPLLSQKSFGFNFSRLALP